MNYIPKITYIELKTAIPKNFTFDTPPEGDPFKESLRPKVSSKRSTAGVKQSQYSYTLRRFDVEFLYQSNALMDSFEDFFNNHASRGGEFKYFPHSDEAEFFTFQMVTTVLNKGRPLADELGDFLYSFKFKAEGLV